MASAVLTRSTPVVPHIEKASELPRRTVSAPAPPAPLVGVDAAVGVSASASELTTGHCVFAGV